MLREKLKNKVFYISLALIFISNILVYKNYNNILKLRLHIENDTLMFANSYHIPIKLIEYNFESEKTNVLNAYLAPKSKNEILKFIKIKNTFPSKKNLKATFKLFGKNDLYKIDIEPFYDN